MPFRKIEAGLVNSNVDNFIGKKGTIFYDNDLGDFRISDGITPGGVQLTFGGGGGGGSYTLPTASTSIKGGVKIDGSTIVISNQVISVGTVPYSSLSGTPTIPTNTNQLTNGAGYIKSSALVGYATETYVNTRGFLTSVSWNDVQSKPSFATVATSGSYTDLTDKPTLFSGSYTDLTNKPTIPTNTNQLTNGAGFITAASLSGYATETYVTTRGYLTSVSWNDVQSKPSFATVATSGSYTDLTDKPTLFSGSYTDLTNKPTIPTDINQLTDTTGLLGQGGGGGTTVITNNIENPYSFNVAGDDSTLREILNGETLRFQGATGISVTSDAEGKITITGPDLSSYATESYVTSQGYITSSALSGYATESFVTSQGYLTTVDWSIITNKPTLFSGSYNDLTDKPTLFSSSYNDLTDKPTIPTNTNELTNGAGFITASALTGYATESYVDTRGYLTSVNWNDITDKPSISGTYSFNVAADDSSLKEILSGESIKFSGSNGITTSSDTEGNITITGPDLSGYATQSYVISALNSAGVTVSETAPTGRLEGALWYSSVDLQMYVLYQNQWVAVSSGFSGNYNDLANKPTNVSQFNNDAGYTTRDEVYAMILEMGQ